MPTFRLALACALAMSMAACAQQTPKPFPHAIITPSPKPLVAVSLTRMDGKPLDLNAFKGKWVWLYFGYTNCPDVCPAAMSYMADEYKKLAHPEQVQGVFVSVDPGRDTLKRLTSFVTYYNPKFVGVTGNKAAIDAIAKEVGAGYVIDKPAQAGGGYNVSHTNLVYVLDPQGRFVATYVPGADPGAMAKDFDVLTEKEPS